MRVLDEDARVDVGVEAEQRVLLRVLAEPLEAVPAGAAERAGRVGEARVDGGDAVAGGVRADCPGADGGAADGRRAAVAAVEAAGGRWSPVG